MVDSCLLRTTGAKHPSRDDSGRPNGPGRVTRWWRAPANQRGRKNHDRILGIHVLSAGHQRRCIGDIRLREPAQDSMF